ncbi:MAG: YicC/YloC family endoribonuclease [Coraliomargaritaceae bacterium]
MTGYGRGTARTPDDTGSVEVEITSVNRKSLDVQVNAPREWPNMQQSSADWLREGFTRGRVQVQFKYNTENESSSVISINHDQLNQALQALRDYASTQGIPFEPDATLLLSLSKMLQENKVPTDWKALEPTVRTAFNRAMEDIKSMRSREGRALADDLNERIDSLRKIAEEVEKLSLQTTNKQRDALLDRLRQFDLEIDLDDERILKELALLADKADISEELTRLNAHLDQFKEFIAARESSGRKMDFLCQEINRELNTTGSKSTQIEITRAIIEGKNSLERIREQVQNVE